LEELVSLAQKIDDGIRSTKVTSGKA